MPPSPSWHRNERRKRASARALLRSALPTKCYALVASAAARLKQHHGSAPTASASALLERDPAVAMPPRASTGWSCQWCAWQHPAAHTECTWCKKTTAPHRPPPKAQAQQKPTPKPRQQRASYASVVADYAHESNFDMFAQLLAQLAPAR